MVSILINPAVAIIEIPLNAAPLVHPLAICAPNPKSNPPVKANTRRLLAVILGANLKWNSKIMRLVLLASIIPFGTFYIDKKILKQQL